MVGSPGREPEKELDFYTQIMHNKQVVMVLAKPLLLPAVLGVRSTGDGVLLVFHVESVPLPVSFHGLWPASWLLAHATLRAFLLDGILDRLSAALYLWPPFLLESALAVDTVEQRLPVHSKQLSLLHENGGELRCLSNV